MKNQVRALLDAPSPAVLAVYRANGTILMSPVWFHADEEWIEVVLLTGNSCRFLSSTCGSMDP